MPLETLRPRLATASTRIAATPLKIADPFYLSAAWRTLMARLIVERGRRCEECGRTEGWNGQPLRIFGDHIHELADGGAPLDAGNVLLRCGKCHTTKTLRVRAERQARGNAGPMPAGG